MVYCGLDASTTTVGWAFTDENKKIVSAGFLDLTPFATNRLKSAAVVALIKSKCPVDCTKLDRINLEGALGGFSGPSSRVVVVKLARWSAVLEFVLQDAFACPINLINATTARKQLFGKARITGIKPKVYVKSMMDKLYDVTPWVVKNRVGNPDKRNEDMLDAVVMATYIPN